MASYSFSLRLHQFLKRRYRANNRGFTLTELLVSIIISAIIVSGLLYLVVELLGTDARESARNETQREMQLAMNYITTDLREAVYVYEDVADIADGLPNFAAAGYKPVLAFWKPVYFDDDDLTALNCTAESTETVCFRRSAYSLVVYLQQDNPGGVWSGQSLIRRYELPRYSDLSTQTVSTGYVDPTGDVNFQDWPGDSQSGTPTLNPPPPVLVDFVAASDTGEDPGCEANYTKSPADSNTFYSCVRSSTPDGGQTADNIQNTNQDVFVFLQGSVQGRRGGAVGGFDTSSRLPVLRSQVMVGGVINKSVAD